MSIRPKKRVNAYLHQAWTRCELKKRARDAGDFQQAKNNVFGTSLGNKICVKFENQH